MYLDSSVIVFCVLVGLWIAYAFISLYQKYLDLKDELAQEERICREYVKRSALYEELYKRADKRYKDICNKG